MKTITIILCIAGMVLIATGFIGYITSISLEKGSVNPADPSVQKENTFQEILLSFPINGTNASFDGEVIIDNISYGMTSHGTISLKNFSTPFQNVTLKKNAFEIMYELPSSLRDLRVFHLIVSQEEYQRYLRYQALYDGDLFQKSAFKHWNHMPLTFAENFSEYSDAKIRASKELKVKYTLERLHAAIPSISFQKSSEQKADIIFRGEIPREIRETNRPDGNFNIEGLALHNVTGNIIFKAEVYIPLPTEGEECPSSDIALHELLHAFGLPHSNNVESVLWDTASCTNNKIIPEDIALLKGIYG